MKSLKTKRHWFSLRYILCKHLAERKFVCVYFVCVRVSETSACVVRKLCLHKITGEYSYSCVFFVCLFLFFFHWYINQILVISITDHNSSILAVLGSRRKNKVLSCMFPIFFVCVCECFSLSSSSPTVLWKPQKGEHSRRSEAGRGQRERRWAGEQRNSRLEPVILASFKVHQVSCCRAGKVFVGFSVKTVVKLWRQERVRGRWPS